MTQKATKSLAVCAMMLAVATLFSLIRYQLPFGGEITFFSMVPLLYVAFHYTLGWASLTALSFSLLQMAIAFYPPPAQSFPAFAGVVLLDYVLAYGMMSLAGIFSRPLNGMKKIMAGSAIAFLGRFLCHFVSGILIWSSNAPEGQPVALYSLLYNGAFVLGEWILSTAALLALEKLAPNQKILP